MSKAVIIVVVAWLAFQGDALHPEWCRLPIAPNNASYIVPVGFFSCIEKVTLSIHKVYSVKYIMYCTLIYDMLIEALLRISCSSVWSPQNAASVRTWRTCWWSAGATGRASGLRTAGCCTERRIRTAMPTCPALSAASPCLLHPLPSHPQPNPHPHPHPHPHPRPTRASACASARARSTSSTTRRRRRRRSSATTASPPPSNSTSIHPLLSSSSSPPPPPPPPPPPAPPARPARRRRSRGPGSGCRCVCSTSSSRRAAPSRSPPFSYALHTAHSLSVCFPSHSVHFTALHLTWISFKCCRVHFGLGSLIERDVSITISSSTAFLECTDSIADCTRVLLMYEISCIVYSCISCNYSRVCIFVYQ